MNKNKIMKKGSFINGMFITTLGIVISKILGIIYVVPFHAIIGEKGGALYGYAYTIYLFFMSLSSAGIPLAISKVVSEYQALGYYNTKKRAFILGKKISLILGTVSFIIMFLFAPLLAKLVMGDVVGGNSISDITYVIRIISLAVLIVPILSVYRGYFEGHRFFSPPSISQVIEQIIRVIIIIFGSLLALKTFHLSLASSVGVALLGATLGALVSYLYLLIKRIKNKSKFNEKARRVNEPMITNKTILRKIVIYALPFILIDFFKSLYNYVDMFTVVKGLVHYANYSIEDAEIIYSMLSTWAAKFNMILLSISTGIIVSLIPNLTESIVKKNHNDIQDKITRALSILLYLTIPMTLGISFLSKNIWLVFYGSSVYGPSILSYYIFVGLFIGLFTAMIITLQTLKDYKGVFISLIAGVIIKIILNTSLIHGFYMMNISAYYGSITASILGYLTSFIICLVILYKKYKINFEVVMKHLVDIICGSILMTIILFVIKFILPDCNGRVLNIFIIILYTVLGCSVYLIYTYKTKTIQTIFGNEIKKFFAKKKNKS